MTHDELLAKIITEFHSDNSVGQKHINQHFALRAVVELHRNVDGACWECQDALYHEYPCPTIRAIQKELK
jgi:hypothetical protein